MAAAVNGVSPSGSSGDKAEDEGEQRGEEGGEVGEEANGEANFKCVRNPPNPTRKEIDEHNINHLPYRSWCPVCVAAKGRETAHYKRGAGDLNEIPVISMDYGFLHGKAKEGEGDGKEESGSGAILVMHDSVRKTVTANTVQTKGPGDGWIVEKYVQILTYSDIPK